MTFAHPGYLWLLLVIPPAILAFFWWSWRERRRLMTQFIHARLLPGLTAGISPTRQKVRAALLISAVACLTLVLARPQWGFDWDEVTQRGLDIIVAIDTSKSMLAEDIAPNRLTRAKLAAIELMQQAKSDRLGLVAFAGTAFLQCPLTIDDTVFRQSVESLNVNTLPAGGTAIAEAINTALAAFKEDDNFKTLVIFTDGEDHDSGALEAAEKARAAGLIIFTIGLGSPDGQLLRIRTPDGRTDYVRDENGNVVSSRLNEALLQQLAGPAPYGFYLPLRGAKTIDTLYERGLAPLPKSESTEKWIKRPRERYHWPLAAATILLLIELFLPERKDPPREPRKRSARRAVPAATALAVLTALLPFTSAASPASALRDYKAGKYDEALKEYEQALQKRSDDPRLHFNAGAAAYRNQQFDQAAEHFKQAALSPNLNLQGHAYYNLGNTLYQIGERNPDPNQKTRQWRESLKHFDSSLKLLPNDRDSQFNQEFVKRRLEELKQQQQQQPNQQPQNPPDENQEKNQQQQQSPGQQQPQQPNEPSRSPQSGQDQSPADGRPSSDQNQNQQQPEAGPAEPGQMTPDQARRLLDTQKDSERMLPPRPDPQRQRPRKDW